MRQSRRRTGHGNLAVWLAVGLGMVCTPAISQADPLKEFYELEDRMAEAQDTYYEATHAKPSERDGSSKARNAPRDVRPDILKKIDALASTTLGKPEGAAIAMGAFYWSWNLDLDLPNLHRRFENLVTYYPDEDGLDDILPQVIPAGAGDDKPQPWIEALKKLSRNAKRRKTKLGTLATLGQLQLTLRKLPEAQAAFEALLAMKPDKELAELAKGYIYEIHHLQVGMVAPDFTARTIDDKKVSLKSLRGKAVLLNFWASW